MRGEFRPEGVRREWCDSEVLRQLRRRSLATLRREVEPVEPEALARFLPAWHGVPPERRGIDAVVEALGLLAGAPIVASTLEADVLASRVDGYRPALLDELCTSGEVVWVGAGAIGSSDGRVRVAFADQLPLLAPGWEVQDRPEGAVHDAVRLVLAERGASFWNQLKAAAPGTADDELLAALWDLVWAGEVTSDSLAPLRAVTGAGRGRARRGAGDRARAAAARRSGPARRAAGGRRPLEPRGARCWHPRPSPTEAAHAMALQLVERHGVVTREAVLAEGVVGGYASVYGVLKVLEERGQVRRGYFVSGLGAAQFALPGAVDRLRLSRERADEAIGSTGAITAPVVLAATDPAQPYGATLAWPESAGPAGPHGGGAGRAARRRADRLVRPPFAPPRDVPAHPRRPLVGRGAGRPGAGRSRCAGSRCARSTVSRCRPHRSTPRSRPPPRPPATPTATAGCSTRRVRWSPDRGRAAVPVASV